MKQVRICLKPYSYSINTVDQLIQNERNQGVPSQRILLGGFSQGKLWDRWFKYRNLTETRIGCVISLLTAVSTPHQLAGVVACSGWLALGEKLDSVSCVDDGDWIGSLIHTKPLVWL